MNTELLKAMLVGIAVMMAIFIMLTRAFPATGTRRALGLFAGACGVITTLYL